MAQRIDNCNFSTVTFWEKTIVAGRTFQYSQDREPGAQYIAEATDLSQVDPAVYDFVLSSHVLEHIANPLRALEEWKRILKPDGLLILVAPHKDRTFDHRRPVTRLEHLIEDYQIGTSEGDLSHLPEVLALHDLEMNPGGNRPEVFQKAMQDNYQNRFLHHHVFDTLRVIEVIDYMQFQIEVVEPVLACNIFVIARKPLPGIKADNQSFVRWWAKWRWRSPFSSDGIARSRFAG